MVVLHLECDKSEFKICNNKKEMSHFKIIGDVFKAILHNISPNKQSKIQTHISLHFHY